MNTCIVGKNALVCAPAAILPSLAVVRWLPYCLLYQWLLVCTPAAILPSLSVAAGVCTGCHIAFSISGCWCVHRLPYCLLYQWLLVCAPAAILPSLSVAAGVCTGCHIAFSISGTLAAILPSLSVVRWLPYCLLYQWHAGCHIAFSISGTLAAILPSLSVAAGVCTGCHIAFSISGCWCVHRLPYCLLYQWLLVCTPAAILPSLYIASLSVAAGVYAGCHIAFSLVMQQGEYCFEGISGSRNCVCHSKCSGHCLFHSRPITETPWKRWEEDVHFLLSWSSLSLSHTHTHTHTHTHAHSFIHTHLHSTPPTPSHSHSGGDKSVSISKRDRPASWSHLCSVCSP